ncbi:response regulator [Aquincola sp. S2]|uniref:Response regulator n=1 Tax=Pseudaquabacterium terrae TaxID=2732868 RepID=A0ABX2ELK4_9BURK|nr:response regulator [Aquabacterium terrae]NRF69531.1 response regulator [Aquabacterium terrae]
MSVPIPVALLGFSAFERNALASYFRLAARRSPHYTHVLDIDEARFVVADADQSGVPELLQALGRIPDAVFVGAQGPDGAASWMMRPIDPVHVLRELDALVALRDNPGSGPLPLLAPTPAHARPTTIGKAVPSPLRRAADEPETPVVSPEERRAAAERSRARREAALRPQPLRRALLVDDSELALHFLDRQLQRYGLATEWAHNSGRALELLSTQAFGFVFVDIDLGPHSDLDGLSLCQQIKHRHVHPGGKAPQLAVVSAFHDPVDRVRSTLAGADIHLGKPLDFETLDRWLSQQGLSRGPELPVQAL